MFINLRIITKPPPNYRGLYKFSPIKVKPGDTTFFNTPSVLLSNPNITVVIDLNQAKSFASVVDNAIIFSPDDSDAGMYEITYKFLDVKQVVIDVKIMSIEVRIDDTVKLGVCPSLIKEDCLP